MEHLGRRKGRCAARSYALHSMRHRRSIWHATSMLPFGYWGALERRAWVRRAPALAQGSMRHTHAFSPPPAEQCGPLQLQLRHPWVRGGKAAHPACMQAHASAPPHARTHACCSTHPCACARPSSCLACASRMGAHWREKLRAHAYACSRACAHTHTHKHRLLHAPAMHPARALLPLDAHACVSMSCTSGMGGMGSRAQHPSIARLPYSRPGSLSIPQHPSRHP